MGGATLLGFDDFDLKLGDMLRGERATMGKSLLDVQRELKIRANYIAAIENCDPTAFETPGFIAGYVRSYARYLGLDADATFDQFCLESGFSVAHGMSEKASSIRKPTDTKPVAKTYSTDPFADKNLAFLPKRESALSKIEPAAIGSSLVLVALLAGVGYGGWSVLQEVQRVQVAPVDQTPQVLSDIGPILVDDETPTETAGIFSPPGDAALDRLYRPEALDLPVLVARDAPISTLDPESTGLYAQYQRSRLPNVNASENAAARAQAAGLTGPNAQPLQGPYQPGMEHLMTAAFTGDVDLGPVANTGNDNAGIRLFASEPVWFKATDADGNTVAAETLDSGTVWTPPTDVTEISVGTSRPYALFALIGSDIYGPMGYGVDWTSMTLDADVITASLSQTQPGDIEALDRALEKAGNAVTAPAPAQPLPTPQVFAEGEPPLTLTSKRRVWMRVTSASGAIIKDFFLAPGETYTLPQLAQAPKLRVGDAGAVFFNVGDTAFGPVGTDGRPKNFENLSLATLQSQYGPADIEGFQIEDLNTAVAQAIAAQVPSD